MKLSAPVRRLIIAVCLALGLFVTARGADTVADRNLRFAKALYAMNAKISALRLEAQKTSDLKERRRLQGEIKDILDATLAQLSETQRPMVEFNAKVSSIFSDEMQNYRLELGEFLNGTDAHLENLNSLAAVDARQAKLAELRTANDTLTQHLKHLETDVITAINLSHGTPPQESGILDYYRLTTGRKLGSALAIRTLEGQTLDAWTSFYALLRDEWGNWTVAKDGQPSFKNTEAAAKHRDIRIEMQNLAERKAKAEQVFAEREAKANRIYAK